MCIPERPGGVGQLAAIDQSHCWSDRQDVDNQGEDEDDETGRQANRITHPLAGLYPSRIAAKEGTWR